VSSRVEEEVTEILEVVLEEVLTRGLVVSLAKKSKLGTQVAEEATEEEGQMNEVGQMDQIEDPSSPT